LIQKRLRFSCDNNHIKGNNFDIHSEVSAKNLKYALSDEAVKGEANEK